MRQYRIINLQRRAVHTLWYGCLCNSPTDDSTNVPPNSSRVCGDVPLAEDSNYFLRRMLKSLGNQQGHCFSNLRGSLDSCYEPTSSQESCGLTLQPRRLNAASRIAVERIDKGAAVAMQVPAQLAAGDARHTRRLGRLRPPISTFDMVNILSIAFAAQTRLSKYQRFPILSLRTVWNDGLKPCGS